MLIKSIMMVLLSVSMMNEPLSKTEFTEPQVLKYVGTSWTVQGSVAEVYIFRDVNRFKTC